MHTWYIGDVTFFGNEDLSGDITIYSSLCRCVGGIQLPTVTSMAQRPTNPLDAPDLPLLEGENPDVRQEAREIMGDWWLEQPNVRLAGETPIKIIEAHRGARVRNIIRSIKYVGIS